MSKKPETETKHPIKLGRVLPIATAHFVHDIYTAFISPILPILIEKLSLSLTQAGSLTVFIQAPSLINPFLGVFADRKKLNRLFVVMAPGLTATFLSLVGLAPNYAIVCLLMFAAGISVAAMHVSGPVMVARNSGNFIGRGMGLFMVGGELARTAGPIVAVWAVSTLKLEGMWVLIPPGLMASAVLWWRLDRPAGSLSDERQFSFAAMLNSMRRVLAAVFGILVARAFLAAAITTYLPTFLYAEGNSLWLSGVSLSLVEVSGAVGVFISGSASDYFGRRVVLLVAAILSPLMLGLMLVASGPLLFISLVALGFTTLATGPVMMAAVWENAGNNKAAVNGTYMAISFGIRSSVVLLVGVFADTWGMRTAFEICIATAFIGIPFIFLLPKKNS